MNIDLRKIPFSRFGSYSVIQLGKLNEKNIDNSLYFRDVGGGDNNLGFIFKIIINTKKDYIIEANETQVTIRVTNSSEKLSICFPDENRVRFNSNGLSFSFDFILDSYDHLNILSKNKWELHNYSNEMKLGLKLLSGNCKSEIIWNRITTTKGLLNFEGQIIDMDVERYQCAALNKEIVLSYEQELILAKKDFITFKENVPIVKDPMFEVGKDMAAYILYSIVVHPLGILSKYAMYMSKNWMTNIWSWDNCFNAIGLCTWNEKLALDQLLIFSDQQAPCGVLPDTMNNLYCSFSCCKPPIQGWAYLKMMSLNSFFKEEAQVKPIYKQLKGLEKYWIEFRISKDYPLPYYNHGNDSGWDNATPFSSGVPVTTPDLPTYLILLYEALEKMAKILKLEKDEEIYRMKGEDMVLKLITNLWDGSTFRSFQHTDKAFTTTGNSLIELTPILISNRLPKEIVSKILTKFISPSFISEHGIATEAMDSPLYEKNGYWRGPIWAPTTLLFIDALKEIGKIELSKKLARAFCENAQTFGMCENYDPISGQGNDDPAFAWTSSVFLILANQYI